MPAGDFAAAEMTLGTQAFHDGEHRGSRLAGGLGEVVATSRTVIG